MMSGSNPADFTLTETPILPHDISNGNKSRYIIQRDLSVKIFDTSDSQENVPVYDGNNLDWQSRLHGSAAALPFSDGTLIRSCGKFEEPNVIDISKVSPLSSTDQSALTSVEVDLSVLEQDNLIGPIVSTRIFPESYVNMDDEMEVISQNSLIKIVLVDVRGVVLMIRLARKDFALPSSSDSLTSVELINTTDLLISNTNHKVASTCLLTDSQVSFIDMDRVVLALAPLLLCLNTDSNQVTSWRGGTCLEHRKQSLGGILKDATRILAGESPSGDLEENFYYGEEEDMMPSIASICAVPSEFDNSTGEENDGIEESITNSANTIISLHSDGSIRRWILPAYRNQKKTIPLRMRMLKEADMDSSIPPPHTWSSTNDSLFLRAFTDSNTLHVAISVRSTESLDERSERSPCHLTLLEASQQEERNVRVKFRELHVPPQANSLAGMNFSIKKIRNKEEWDLCVVFNTQIHDGSGVLVASYNKNADQPTLIPSNFTIDKVAQEERKRMRCECNLVDDEKKVEEVDTDFMKRLFRPMTLCTSGRPKPSDGSIIRAFQKLVPSLCMDIGFGLSRTHGSIEAKTIRLMRDWRRMEEAKALIEANTRERKRRTSVQDNTTQPHPKQSSNESSSVYREFVKPSVMDVGISKDDSKTHFFDISSAGTRQDRKQRVVSHYERWRKLLFAVLDEESKQRIPLLIKSSSGNDLITVIRAGVTSSIILSLKPSYNESLSNIDTLDMGAITLLTRLRNKDPETFKKLSKLELQISSMVSKAKLLLPDGKDAMNSLVDCVMRDISSRSLQDAEVDELMDIMQSMSTTDTQEWLRSPLSSSSLFQVSLSPGFSFQNENGGFEEEDYPKKSGYQSLIASSAAILVHQFLESIQQLALARCLLVCSNDFLGIFDNEQIFTALRTYLYATSILWINNQITSQVDNESRESALIRPKVPPPGAFSQVIDESTSDESGLYFGEKFILNEPRSKDKEIIEKSVLYFQLLGKTKGSKTLSSNFSISEATITLSKNFIRSTFSSNDLKLPELGGLFTDLSEKSRFNLRLVAPFVAYPPSYENITIESHRKTVAADCLLAEVKELQRIGALDSKEMVDLQHCASELLRVASPPDESLDAGDMDICLEVLRSAPNKAYRSSADMNDHFESRLIDLLHFILDEGDSVTYEDAIQLSSLETVRMLFMPWLLGSSQSDRKEDIFANILRSFPDSVARASCIVKYTSRILLQASKSMRRLTILETHAVSSSNQYICDSNAALLISAVEDVIKIFQEHFSFKVLNDYVVELSPLWSLSFRYSVLGQKWNKAFEACILNPSADSKARKFQRLVLAMVENGFLYELIGMLNATMIKEMDLYELAAETLADAATHQTNNRMSGQPKVNFCGSLYALHAAQSNWRRCCEAMNFYGSLTLTKFVGNKTYTADTADTTQQHSFNQCNINSLTLAAVSSAMLIKLISNAKDRFIIDGELSPFPLPAPDNRMDEMHSDTDSAVSSMSAMVFESFDKSRTSKLLTENELDIRALRMMTMKILSMDSLSPDSAFDIIQSSDPEAIDALARLGYFSHAVSFAQLKREHNQGARPGGRDILFDAVSHVLCQSVAPAAAKLSRPTPLNTFLDGIDEEPDEDDELRIRPTSKQLRLTIGNGEYIQCCERWRKGSMTPDITRGRALMEALRQLTLAHSSCDNSLAIEVAGSLLELDDGRSKLPLWLTDLLKEKNERQSSAFATSSPGSDPGALLRLFMVHGLYEDACKLVMSTLMEGIRKKESQRSSLLPERGHIDYVPYDAVDTLWELIENEVKSTKCNPKRKACLTEARDQMEISLEKYFEFMRTSEMGLLSARALNSR